jgi:hypothetical protein
MVILIGLLPFLLVGTKQIDERQRTIIITIRVPAADGDYD